MSGKLLIEYPFKMKPREHQLAAWRMSKDREFFAQLMEYGTGKTKVTIDTATYLFDQGNIDRMLVVAPKGVYRNWTEIEIPKHCADHVTPWCAWHDAAAGVKAKRELDLFMRERDAKRLKVLALNVESVITPRGVELARDFLKGGPALMVMDEFTTIKNPKAKRTKMVIGLGKLAKYRRGLCGNPYANSPLDVYAPFEFLKPGALGFTSYFAFKARFAKLVDMRVPIGQGKVRVVKRVDGYRDLEKLKALVKPHSFTVKKNECLDLPPKIYLAPRDVEMEPRQKKAYEEMRKYGLMEIGRQLELNLAGDEVEVSLADLAGATHAQDDAPALQSASADIVLTQLLRLQQITCGYVTTDDGAEVDLWDASNPKVDALMEAVAENAGKTIIWCPFKRPINQIIAALTKEYGADSVVRFDGTVTNSSELERAKKEFQDPNSAVRFFVGSQQKGSRGITLTMASLVLYFADCYDGELREQSEDRAHRDGLEHSVSYQNLRVRGTVDDKISDALTSKKTIGDLLRDGTWRRLFEKD